MLKRLYFLVTAAVIGLFSLFFILALQSQSGQAVGLIDGKLAACPPSPNCISSEYPDDKSHYLPPIMFNSVQAETILSKAKRLITQQGGEITVTKSNYLAATFASRLFGFVDDLEIRLDPQQKQLHLRSSARVGYSDMGINTKRAQHLSQRLNAQLNPPIM